MAENTGLNLFDADKTKKKDKVELIVMKCPTCGGELDVDDAKKSIVCLNCDNKIKPVSLETPSNQSMSNDNHGGVIKVEGIKTSSSALAYIDIFFDEYDWEAFSYAQSLSVHEMDSLASSLKVSSADDKNTWLACFKVKCVPFMKKIAGCKQILASVIEEYRMDNLDAYSKFDAYKRIVSMILQNKDAVISELTKFAAAAEKYGASTEEVQALRDNIAAIVESCDLAQYADVERIPEISKIIDEKNRKITEDLAKKGYNAPALYQKANDLIKQRDYVNALSILRSLKGYADSDKLAEKVDKYFLISDVLEVGGKLYFFRKTNENADTYELMPTANGKIGNKPIIRNIAKIITNYADILYYIDSGYKLKRFNLATGVEEKVYKKSLNKKSIYVYGRKVYLLGSTTDDDYESSTYNMVELDVAAGTARVLIEKVKKILSMNGSRLVYTIRVKTGTGSEAAYHTYTNVLDVDTMKQVSIGCDSPTVEGYLGDLVVYTKNAPNAYNMDLYVKNIITNEPERLLERNIFKFSSIIEDKVFYYIGNSENATLININSDGTGRKEWPLFVNKVLFAQGGWVYFIRKSGYNTVLCKSRLDGSKYKIIARDIEEFIDIKNGYLYYINDESTLVKVRMDGSNLQELCDDVEKVLSVKEDKIIFVSVDDRIKIQNLEIVSYKTVKSIYAVDFTGSGKIKLAYDITNAKEYDDDKVYYVDGNPGVLHRLDVDSNRSSKLLELQSVPSEGGWGYLVAIFVLIFSALIMLVSFATDNGGLGIFMLLVSIVSAWIAVYLKLFKNKN